jgi:hypothetical protein
VPGTKDNPAELGEVVVVDDYWVRIAEIGTYISVVYCRTGGVCGRYLTIVLSVEVGNNERPEQYSFGSGLEVEWFGVLEPYVDGYVRKAWDPRPENDQLVLEDLPYPNLIAQGGSVVPQGGSITGQVTISAGLLEEEIYQSGEATIIFQPKYSDEAGYWYVELPDPLFEES